MNEVIAALACTFAIGLAYFVCAMLRHGTCDMGKMFNLLVIDGSFVTGIYLCFHAVELARASHSDGAWVGVAGCMVALFSVQQGIIIFRELFAKRVDPRRLDDSLGR